MRDDERVPAILILPAILIRANGERERFKINPGADYYLERVHSGERCFRRETLYYTDAFIGPIEVVSGVIPAYREWGDLGGPLRGRVRYTLFYREVPR